LPGLDLFTDIDMNCFDATSSGGANKIAASRFDRANAEQG
jgi:hypothetical protein